MVLFRVWFIIVFRGGRCWLGSFTLCLFFFLWLFFEVLGFRLVDVSCVVYFSGVRLWFRVEAWL